MRLITPAIAVSLFILHTECTPVVSPSTPHAPSATSTTSSTAEPEAEEEAEPAPATILLRTDFFAVLDEDDVVMQQFDYFDDPTAAIAALTEVFGGEPTVTAFEGYTHQWPGNQYSWDAFSIIDWVGGGGIAYGEDYAVTARSAVVRGLSVETVGDITVGSTEAQLGAAGALVQGFSYEGTTATWYELDGRPATDPEWAGWEGGPRIYVNAAVDAAGGPVTQLTAPVANYGV